MSTHQITVTDDELSTIYWGLHTYKDYLEREHFVKFPDVRKYADRIIGEIDRIMDNIIAIRQIEGGSDNDEA